MFMYIVLRSKTFVSWEKVVYIVVHSVHVDDPVAPLLLVVEIR